MVCWRTLVMRKRLAGEGLTYADLLKVDLALNLLCMCGWFVCVDVAKVLQGHKAVMHEQINSKCAEASGQKLPLVWLGKCLDCQ